MVKRFNHERKRTINGMKASFKPVLIPKLIVIFHCFKGIPTVVIFSLILCTFAKTGDIYCLFYEKGLNLLKDNGILTYITSNKWMRAGYGKNLRRFLSPLFYG